MTIFWGIMLAWILPTLLGIALVIVFFIIGSAMRQSILTEPRIPSGANRP